MRLPLRLAALAVPSAALLVGCASGHPDTRVLHAGDVSVLMEAQAFGGDVAGAGLDGRLAVVDGCLGIGGAMPRVLVFPPGTTVAGEGRDLVLTVEGLALSVGDAFEANTRSNDGGGPLAGYGSLDEQAPESCRSATAIDVNGFRAP